MKKSLLAFFLIFFSLPAMAADRLITHFGDDLVEGSLRVVLQYACVDAGDDVIRFAHTYLPEIYIVLSSPLVIPPGCQGHVSLAGSDEVETILDGTLIGPMGGGQTPGDSCILDVYSDGHEIKNFTFLGNDSGAGICLFGKDNEVSGNIFGRRKSGQPRPNKYGIVVSDIFSVKNPQQYPWMDGSGNKIENNQIGPSGQNGLWSHAKNLLFSKNKVENSGSDGVKLAGEGLQVLDNEITENEGDGIHMDGSGNKIENNQIGPSGQNGLWSHAKNLLFSKNKVVSSGSDGVRLAGEGFQVLDNEITGNGGDGIRIEGPNSIISSNKILANGGCPSEGPLPSQTILCLGDTGGVGLLIEEGSSGLIVGGGSFEKDKNVIQYNEGGGVVVLGDAKNDKIRITHNVVSKNYGPAPNIDLGGDGITENDPKDPDEGPNHLLNFIDYLQAFPLVPSPDNKPRYWTWGIAREGNFVEIYRVSPEDSSRKIIHGGGDLFFGESSIVGRTFHAGPNDPWESKAQGWVTVLSFDDPGDTSEYSKNIAVGSDWDLDGILDIYEQGFIFGRYEKDKSSLFSTDTDGDGLPDSVEDSNRNGVWEPELGETSAYLADSDGDGISDWYETGGDGRYDPGTDTDPLNPDTDGDGIPDGAEDKNGNGIWEAYLGETNPRLADSDGDGFSDAVDTCPTVANPGQEPWYCAP